jgi:hypothetical protein
VAAIEFPNVSVSCRRNILSGRLSAIKGQSKVTGCKASPVLATRPSSLATSAGTKLAVAAS